MPDDIPSPDRIEKEIEAERSKLVDTLDTLTDRVSVDRWLDDAASSLQGAGADVADTIRRSARDNPAALALTGAGLALAAFGAARVFSNTSDRGAPARIADHHSADAYGAAHHERREPVGYDNATRPTSRGFRDDDPLGPDFDARVAAADEAMKDSERSSSEDNRTSLTYDPWDIEERADGEDFPKDEDESSTAARLQRSARELYGEASTRAADLRARLRDGLDDLSDQARERVLRARLKAIEVQDAAERQTRRTMRETGSAFQKNPLLFGLGAVAAGAAAAALIPRSSDDRQKMDALRRRVMDEARTVYFEERSRVAAAAKAALSEGASVAKAAAGDVLDPDRETDIDVKRMQNKVVRAAGDAYEKHSQKGDSQSDGKTSHMPTPNDSKKPAKS